jgi:hypothetical protein
MLNLTSLFSLDDPKRAFIGIANDGMSADDLMRMTRGDDWPPLHFAATASAVATKPGY